MTVLNNLQIQQALYVVFVQDHPLEETTRKGIHSQRVQSLQLHLDPWRVEGEHEDGNLRIIRPNLFQEFDLSPLLQQSSLS